MTITTTAPAATPGDPGQPVWLASVRARAAAALIDPFHVTDCEGDLSVWRQSALEHVTRNSNGDITGWSTPSSYKVTDQIIEIGLDTWDEGEDPLEDQQRGDIKALVTARDRDVPRLVAYIDQLHARLAAAEAALPGITHLNPGQPVELTVYRTEHDTIPAGLFTNRTAARDCGEDHLRRELARPGITAAWIPDHSGDDAVEELSIFGPGDEEEDATGYVVTPLTVTAVYAPETDE
ncbi:hypothetical protein [Streptomyces lutosisoli]|uniref:Uncharacterized protein n=1 Tax=Streptomyces lutosisoli TaxID=2665721 RepID=A0ABW2VW85_9ACTN